MQLIRVLFSNLAGGKKFQKYLSLGFFASAGICAGISIFYFLTRNFAPGCLNWDTYCQIAFRNTRENQVAEFATIACFGLGVALLSFVPFNFWSRIYNKIPSNLLKGIIVFSLIPLGISFLWTSYSAISFPGNVLIFTFWMKTFYLFGPPQYYSVDIESAFFFFTALFAMFLLYFRKSGAIKGAVRSLELAIFILTCLCVNWSGPRLLETLLAHSYG